MRDGENEVVIQNVTGVKRGKSDLVLLCMSLLLYLRRHIQDTFNPHLSRQVEVITQVLDALVGEAPVVVTPGKVLLHITPRLQALW